jgi:PGF-pre-PGF domain-containing protein
VDETKIKLNRYNTTSGAWESYAATKIAESAGILTYTATLPRLSIFVITGTVLPTPTETAGAPSVGGGGGAPGAPTLPTGVVVEVSLTKMIDFGLAERTYTMNFTDPRQPITEIEFKLLQSTKDFSASVVKITAPPSDVGAAPGKVHSYLIISIGLPSAYYDEIKIKFNIDRAWLASQGISEGDIALYIYKDGEWVQLPTMIVAKDGVVSYIAISPSFSYFTISTIPPVVTPTPTPTPVITPTPTPVITPTPTPTPKPFPGFEVGIAITVLLALAIHLGRRKM